MRASVLLAVVSALALAAPEAAADDPANITVAESLFRDAKALVARGEYAAACPKFAESHRLDPKLGTILNLAACHESAGKIASAWGEFNEALRLAQKQGRKDREDYAAEHAAALEKQLSRVTFTSDEPSGLELTLDDRSLSAALLGTPLPLDPGPHKLIARRVGRVAATIDLDVPKGPSSQTVVIPHLAAAPPMDLGFGSASAPATGAPGEQPGSSGGWKRTAGWIGIGIGVAGAGAATYFGLRASSKHDDGNARCTGNLCDQEGLDLQDEARSLATISTISGVVSIVGLGVGAFLLLTAPSRAATVGLRQRGFDVRGEF